MKIYLCLLLVAIAAVMVGIFVARVNGFVLIQWNHTSIAMPLWLGGVMSIVSAIFLYWLWRIFRLTLKILL